MNLKSFLTVLLIITGINLFIVLPFEGWFILPKMLSAFSFFVLGDVIGRASLYDKIIKKVHTGKSTIEKASFRQEYDDIIKNNKPVRK